MGVLPVVPSGSPTSDCWVRTAGCLLIISMNSGSVWQRGTSVISGVAPTLWCEGVGRGRMEAFFGPRRSARAMGAAAMQRLYQHSMLRKVLFK